MSQKSDLISRQAAIDECDKQYPNIDRQDFKAVINAVPSADRPTTDCTKFMEWLKAEVLDEENWELNAVANGEVICRKFRKLGWLDVEDGYYVDTRPIGEWVDADGNKVRLDVDGHPLDSCWCSNCGEWLVASDGQEVLGKFCPNCGANMVREDGEEE